MKEEEQNAFPALHLDGHRGMTLRDYFAGQAITQLPFAKTKPKNAFNFIKWFFGFEYRGCSMPISVGVENAYKIADAMLKQREL
jgi:hypothetical protein